jgi:predicted permease
MNDLKRAFLCWRHSPGFAAVAVLTLGLAIGANTTIFSLVTAIVFPKPEFPQADRLITVSETSLTELCEGCGVGTSLPTLADLRRGATTVGEIGAYVEGTAVLSAPLVPVNVSMARVSWPLFGTLGVQPQAGRNFSKEDAQPGAAPVVMLSDLMWRTRFAADPRVIGTDLRVDGVPHRVIGVMAGDIRFPEFAEMWTPLVTDGFAADAPGARRDDRSIGVVARLKDGVTVDQARAEFTAIASGLSASIPEQKAWSVAVQTLGDDRADETGTAFTALLGAVGLVLAVACANLGALFLARASRRYRELAIRTALGATRGRLIRETLFESLQISALGGLVGLALASAGMRMTSLGIDTPIPYYVHFAIDWRVIVFAVASSLLAGVLCGLAPSLAATRPDVIRGLKAGGNSGIGVDRRQSLIRRGMLVAELALVMILLAGAALMGKTFMRFHAPPLFDLRGLTMASVAWSGAKYADEAAAGRAAAELEQAMAATPGWRSGFAHMEFLRGFGADARPTRTSSGEVPPDRAARFAYSITPGYFAAQGLPLRSGRAFADADRAGTEPVVIVNESFAEGAWPGQSALGQRILLPIEGAPAAWRTVVGVVSDTDPPRGASRRANPLVYLPFAQLARRPIEILVRAGAPAATVGAELQRMVSAIDPDQPVINARDAVRDRARQYWEIGYLASIYTAFAVFALILAVIGLYGIVSQSVTERTREFGVRIALGAEPGRLSRTVMRGSLWLCVAGAAIGLGGAALVTRVLRQMLFGTDPLDPIVLGSVAALLIATTLAASYWPARRATKVDPLTALKAD